MQRKHTETDEILEELLNDQGPERPLRGHELIRMVYAGRIPPGEYRYETEYMDGRKLIETFEADKEGRVRNLKIWVEDPDAADPEPEKQRVKARRSGAAPATKRGTRKSDR